MSVLVPAILLAIAVVFFVLHPVAVGLESPMGGEDEELTEAQHRKRVALLALRDVEYDFQAGKLDEPDYLRMKGELAREALEAIDREEAEWMAREADHLPAGGEAPEQPARIPEEMEAEIAALRAAIREGVVCPQCAHPNPRGSQFCGNCGSALPRTVPR